jgi:NitT/TauT family transport system permease protein
MPTLVAVNAIPKLAFAPLLIVWMGFGPGPKIVMVVLMSFITIVLAVATGLTRTPADLVELAPPWPRPAGKSSPGSGSRQRCHRSSTA